MLLLWKVNIVLSVITYHRTFALAGDKNNLTAYRIPSSALRVRSRSLWFMRFSYPPAAYSIIIAPDGYSRQRIREDVTGDQPTALILPTHQFPIFFFFIINYYYCGRRRRRPTTARSAGRRYVANLSFTRTDLFFGVPSFVTSDDCQTAWRLSVVHETSRRQPVSYRCCPCQLP